MQKLKIHSEIFAMGRDDNISFSTMGRVGAGLLFLLLFSCNPLQPVTVGGVENTKLKKLSREGIEFEFGLKIKNPNSIGVTVYPSSFEIILNDIELGTVKLNRKVKIKARSDDTPVFQMASDFSKLGLGDLARIMPILTSKSATVSVKGYVKVGKWYYKKKFPVEFRKNIGLAK